MLVTGQVYDNSTGKGIPYASIQITADGKTFMGGVAADEYGLYYLDNPQLDTSKYLYVSSTGYMPVLVTDDVYVQSGQIGLDQSATNLPAVYVTPTNKNADGWLMFILVSGGLTALLVAGENEKRKQKVSGLTVPTLSQDKWIDIALKIGIPVAIFFLIIKPILVALNILPDKQEAAQNQSDQAAQNQQEQFGIYDANDNHQYTADEMDNVAVALRRATHDWWGYDWPSIASQLTWLPGMTVADAQYFLGTFVKKNGYTLYRWYYNEFVDAAVLTFFKWEYVYWQPGLGGTGSPHDYSGFYNKMGVTEDNARLFTWAEVVDKFISYTYRLAGVAKQ